MSSNEHSPRENCQPLASRGRHDFPSPSHLPDQRGRRVRWLTQRFAVLLALAFVMAAGATYSLPTAEATQVPAPRNADEDRSGDVSVGDTLTYDITATNSGLVTLTNVIVSDQLTGETRACAVVAPGGTCVLTVTYKVSQVDVEAGQISTTGTANSDQTGVVALTDPGTVSVPRPSLAVDNPAPSNADEDGSGSVSEDDTLTYAITATNIGTANLTDVLVSDNLITPTGGSILCALVLPGGTCTLRGTYVVTAADVAAGQIDNLGTADSHQTGPVEESVTVSVLQAPSIDLTTTGALDLGVDGIATPGDAVSYGFRVENAGNVSVSNLVVDDAKAGVTDCVIGTLLPGAVNDTSCSGSYELTQEDIDAGEVANQAFVSGEAPSGAITAEATFTVEVEQSPSIEITKTGALDMGADGIATAGDVISLSFVVRNTGNTTLNDVAVNDAKFGVTDCLIGTLPPGGLNDTTCSGSYVLTQADIDAGQLTDRAMAAGEAPTGVVTDIAEDNGSSGLVIPQHPALTVDRVATANADEDGSTDVSLDDTLTYAITATNTGNVMLTNVVVGDRLTGAETSCPAVTPVSTCVLEMFYAVTRANVDAGGIPNLAFATSDQTGEVSSTGQSFDEVAGASTEAPANFLNVVQGWSGLSTDLEVIATNLSFALLALLTLLVATTVFNSTLEENAAEVDTAVKRISGSPQIAPIFAALGWISADEAGGQSRWLALLKPGAIVLITALIYALLEPNFGFNDETLVVVAALMAGIAMATFLYEGGQVFWASKHYETPAAMRVYPLAILIALGCVALTRVTNLHPGIIFGFVTAAAIFPRGEMSGRAKGLIIAVPLIGLMLVSLAAFLLIDPLRDFSLNNASIWATLPDTIAIALFVGGSESALLILIPVTFNDGEKIWNWSKLVWFALALPAAFAFFHVIVNEEEFGELVGDTQAMTLVIICLVVLAISIVTWLFFRLRNQEGEAA